MKERLRLTEDEQNRIIAEWLEPKPSYKPAMRVEGRTITIDGQPSRMMAWIYRETSGWEPRNFLADEVASAMLVDRLIVECIQLRLHQFLATFPIKGGLVLDAINSDGLLVYSSNYVERKVAVRNAAIEYLYSKGLK